MTIEMRKLVKMEERKRNHLKIVYSPNKKMKQTKTMCNVFILHKLCLNE